MAEVSRDYMNVGRQITDFEKVTQRTSRIPSRN